MKMHNVDNTRVSFARQIEYNDRGDFNATAQVNKIHREMLNRYTGSESFRRRAR